MTQRSPDQNDDPQALPPHAQAKLRMTPLHNAARNGDIQQLQEILATGTDLQQTDSENATALHWAIAWGHPNAANFLLNQGAQPNAADDQGITPLHLAAKKGQTFTELFERLLNDPKAQIEAPTHSGETPLHYAATRGRLDKIKALIKAGANPHAKTNQGFTPHQLATRRKRNDVAAYLAKTQNT